MTAADHWLTAEPPSTSVVSCRVSSPHLSSALPRFIFTAGCASPCPVVVQQAQFNRPVEYDPSLLRQQQAAVAARTSPGLTRSYPSREQQLKNELGFDGEEEKSNADDASEQSSRISRLQADDDEQSQHSSRPVRRCSCSRRHRDTPLTGSSASLSLSVRSRCRRGGVGAAGRAGAGGSGCSAGRERDAALADCSLCLLALTRACATVCSAPKPARAGQRSEWRSCRG